MTNKYVRSNNNPGAVINRDVEGLQAYKDKKRMAAKQREELTAIRSEIDSMKSDFDEIKSLLRELLGKN